MLEKTKRFYVEKANFLFIYSKFLEHAEFFFTFCLEKRIFSGRGVDHPPL